MKKAKIYVLAVLAGLVTLTSCSSDNGDDNTGSDFDRKAMLTNYADNLIVPGYQRFTVVTNEMKAAVDAFVAAPTAATLNTARQKYQQAYLTWQELSPYEFGPADEQMLRSNLNVFPTSATQIESNITAGTYDLQASANLVAKGFPALDYLLYGQATEADVVAQYTTATNVANRKKYLQDITNLVVQHAQNTYNAWTTQNYSTTFKQSEGTAVGSAIGNLVNQLNSDIDITKRYKLGIPAGKFTAGTARPTEAEAYYSGTSLELLLQNLRAEKAIFLGMSADGTNGIGLDDYLNHVNAKKDNMLLSDAIEQQFNLAIAAAEAVNAPIKDAVTTNQAAVNKVYDELQKLIVLTKTDMPSKLGVTISYTDNDGD
ncbi:imelysin family protein [Pontibacter sp. KCTC 32443]|uniref:imelysin family protein n=1 Tax=Pontibacter TaxID=323449 RepID=UPI00164ED7D3|nr:MULTISPECIES: imelysin family protein [Pontibacter]MBC5774404.1 imelysin family protein [Pontibacter sp. KCTC 32443]